MVEQNETKPKPTFADLVREDAQKEARQRKKEVKKQAQVEGE
jgi:F0F1-type ATP synthase membrane subunit b/b'